MAANWSELCSEMCCDGEVHGNRVIWAQGGIKKVFVLLLNVVRRAYWCIVKWGSGGKDDFTGRKVKWSRDK